MRIHEDDFSRLKKILGLDMERMEKLKTIKKMEVIWTVEYFKGKYTKLVDEEEVRPNKADNSLN